jgi:hypothetical protein
LALSIGFAADFLRRDGCTASQGAVDGPHNAPMLAWTGARMTKKPTHDELVKRLHTPGWRLIADDDKSHAASGTLKDVLEATHERKTRKKAPGLIQHIETTLELDAIQIQNLWHYLGLPTI